MIPLGGGTKAGGLPNDWISIPVSVLTVSSAVECMYTQNDRRGLLMTIYPPYTHTGRINSCRWQNFF